MTTRPNPFATTTAGALLVVRRRARADRGLVLGSLLLVVVTCFLALSGPRLLASAVDAGARDAVERAGTGADLVAELPSTVTTAGIRYQADAASLLRAAGHDMSDALPHEIAPVAGAPVTGFVADARLLTHPGSAVAAGLAWWSTLADTGMTWVEGAGPGPSPVLPDRSDLGPGEEMPTQLVEVAISRDNAESLELHVGDHLPMLRGSSQTVEAVVVGIFEPSDTTDPVWDVTTGLLRAGTTAGTQVIPRVGLVLSDTSLPDAIAATASETQRAWVRFPVVADGFAGAEAPALANALSRVAADPSPLLTSYGVPGIRTELTTVLAEYGERLRGVYAQAYLVLTGVVAVGALSLLLAGRLVVERRRQVLAAERARGASVAWVALTLAGESVPLAALGLGLGALAASAVAPGTAWVWGPGVAVAVAASLAVPVGGALLVARAWTGRQLPANKRDRERLANRERGRRLVAEAGVVVLALGAAAAVRGRGLLQSQTQQVDLLLVATPALLAAAGTVVVVRALPPVMRLVGGLTTRSRGIVPVVAAARAARSHGTGLPLLSLAISLALVVFSGSVAASVAEGQVRAADQRVGADVRIDGTLPDGLAAQLRAAPGVDAAAAGLRTPGRTFNLNSGQKVTLLAVEAAELDPILARHDERYAGELQQLAPQDPGAAPRALVSPGLLDAVHSIGASVFGGNGFIDLDVVGTTDLAAAGEQLVIVDLDVFAAAGTDLTVPDMLWVDGPGAVDAVDAAQLDDEAGLTVSDREQWLADIHASPLTTGMLDLLRVAAVVLALLASVALALTVVATAPERGRTLSALRTLGLDGRLARRITIGELLPLSLAALVAGGAIGIGLPRVLGDALGLGSLTGELRAAPATFSATSLALATGAMLLALVVSVGVEAVVRRRDRLGDVLRVGER
ncbi:FtsX-like permease family protein [Cellulomonas sp. P22]|uniref:FtsX-like permease family protein n=1 Tax=Cellulomonas sp. P22 TaxID=3373189 RepID=UPI0037BC403A